ncbi:glutamine amidotransferase [Anaeromyxobacter terrae]|uniref:glutamine amidotransferase n=1 Tax=Anaeromyxobacter terrae TaxID=2925406 RepID=UPI001F55F55B|nr:glutamine amidotransferase [Anaeromyxobacter sp. SG22]
MDGGYNAWRLTALTPLPAWAIALAALAAAGAVLLALRGLRSEPRRARRAALLALRALAAVLALFLLLEPAVELLQTARVRNRFAVLVDASRSMNFPVERDGEPRAAAAGAFLAGHRADLERLSDRVDLEWYTFGADVAPVDPAEASRGIPGRAGRTDLLGALDAIASGQSGSTRRLAGVLVVSDGADNAALSDGVGPEARAKARALGIPVNAIAVGRGAPKDLAVERVAVDEFAFVRNTVTVDVTLRARGFSDEEVRLVLRREGAVVASATVRLERGRDRYTVPLSFAPDETGTFVFTVAAPVFPGEAVVENNARSFVLRVIRDRVRVLLVAGRPSWDVRFLRGLLKQDPNVDLVSFFILRSNADDAGPQQDLSLIPFPVAEIFGEQLRTFDAVVFVNFAYAPYRGLEIERFLPALREYVRGGGALAMVGGEQSFGDGRYGETALADVLPVAPIDGSSMAEGEVAPRLTAEGKRHPVTSLAPGDAANEGAWRGLPPITAVNLTRALAAGSGASVLLEAPAVLVEGRPAPLVAVREVGEGRTLAVATDATWRWGFLAAESGQGNRAYLRFWNQALRWLVRDPGLAPLQVEPDAPAVEPGAPVGIAVTSRRPDFGPAAGDRVAAELVDDDGRSVARGEAAAGEDGVARVALVAPGPGAYKIVAHGPDGATATGAVAVRGSGPEDADAAPRPELLSALSEATGGAFSALPGGKLPELKLANPEVVEIGRRKSMPVWDRWWYLAALASVLAGEWVLRRRWGYW